MQKYIKKKIEVQAIQYDGMPESLEELVALGLDYRLGENSSITIITSRGEVTGEVGDYILMSVTGDFEICNQDKFQKLYSEEHEIQESETTNITDLPADEIESTPELPKEKIIKKLSVLDWFQLIASFLDVLVIIITPLVLDIMMQNSIKTTVESIYKDEIQRESILLLEKTKAESLQIIEQAKKDAVIEADEAFKKEMERLTIERVKK